MSVSRGAIESYAFCPLDAAKKNDIQQVEIDAAIRCTVHVRLDACTQDFPLRLLGFVHTFRLGGRVLHKAVETLSAIALPPPDSSAGLSSKG